MVRLDEGRFPALELNNRRLSVKNSFCRKNGIYTRLVCVHESQFPLIRNIYSSITWQIEYNRLDQYLVE